MKNNLIIILALITAIALFVGIYFGKFYYLNILCKNTINTSFIYIERNSDTRKVLNLLISENLLKDTALLHEFMIKKNYQGRLIVPGKYKIIKGLSNNELVNSLRAGNGKIDTKIKIGQVQTLDILAKSMSKELKLNENQIADFINNRDSMFNYGFAPETQIAMFLPNTYFVDWDITAREITDLMFIEYQTFWNNDRLSKLQSLNMSRQEVHTLASIVYWETKKKEDMPIIAGVYLNRLKIGMPLQADPTVIYAKGNFTVSRVYLNDLKFESPYNTYLYQGLPPGPILTAPEKYIDAVLDFIQHDYLFFVANADLSGYSVFATNYEDHKINAKKYQRKLDSLNIE